MIKKRTVFILGAGASITYKFPSGQQLIADMVKQFTDLEKLPGANHEKRERELTMGRLGVDIKKVRQLIQLLKEMPTVSIDDLLEKRPEFIKEGKYLIADVLID